jgi:hypothetical protein
MVTGWAGDRALEITSPAGRRTVTADVVVIATGARERPRPGRRIPGDRPAGVFTTGQLQNQVHLLHREVGHQAVVVGAELVSWSAVMTLREAARGKPGSRQMRPSRIDGRRRWNDCEDRQRRASTGRLMSFKPT